ncbi:MAG TPA: T9SS type A sorting domain-containing protein [Ignavibacteria bacterium]|nr:T9SS type A sorting domain-containing protein [Ignavibacteria bacterium]
MKNIKLILIALTLNFFISINSYSFPAELASFSANVNTNIVTLTWDTVIEINNNGFLVEWKNIDSINWNQLGFVTGNGITNIPHSYQYIDTVLIQGSYNYRLKQVDFNNTFQFYELSNFVIINTISISSINSIFSDKFELFQNYPNPFNPVTKISYDLPLTNFVTLKVYDIPGNEISTLVNNKQTAGRYEVLFDASNLGSGMYFYNLRVSLSNSLETGNYCKVKRMSFIK